MTNAEKRYLRAKQIVLNYEKNLKELNKDSHWRELNINVRANNIIYKFLRHVLRYESDVINEMSAEKLSGLINMTDLLKERNCGQHSINIIEKALNAVGLKLLPF